MAHIKVNLDKPAALIDGTPVYWEGEAKVRATWAFLAYKAVAARYQDDANLDFDQSARRATLARKLCKGGDLELTDWESLETKRLFAKRWDPDYVAGFCDSFGI